MLLDPHINRSYSKTWLNNDEKKQMVGFQTNLQ